MSIRWLNIIIAIVLSYYSLKKYVMARINYEHTLYWGISFVMVAAANLILILEGKYQFDYYLIPYFQSLAYWLMAYAVMLSVYSLRTRTRKSLRTVLWLILVILFPFLVSTTLWGIPATTFLQIGLLLSITIFLTTVKKNHMFFSFAMILISEVLTLFMVPELVSFANGIHCIGYLYLFYNVHKLIYK